VVAENRPCPRFPPWLQDGKGGGRSATAPIVSRTDPDSFSKQATARPALIPHDAPGSCRRYPPIPARQRTEIPATAGIAAYPRSGRKRHDRPVTPEVAGSSPVAPASKGTAKPLVASYLLGRRPRNSAASGQQTSACTEPHQLACAMARLPLIVSTTAPARARCLRLHRMASASPAWTTASRHDRTDHNGLSVAANEGLRLDVLTQSFLDAHAERPRGP
jgi:hypothetical protein